MTKSKKIVIIILACVLALTATFAILTLNKGFLSKLTGSLDAGNGGMSFSELAPVGFETDYPLVQTQKSDLFYEAFPDGTINYYNYADGTFTKADGVKTKDVTISCSYQNVKVKLYYLNTDIGTVGYGIYTSAQKSGIKLFSYIFVRLMDCPDSYKSSAATDYILLTDMDSQDAYKTDKTYSDMYSYNMSSGKTTLVVSQRDRLVQEDGTMREDWTVFKDSSLNSMKKYDYFATARNHDTKTDSKIYDIISVANSRSMKKTSATTVSDSPSYDIIENDGNYYCFANSDDGFTLVKNGDTDKPIASFSGSFSDYSVNGKWILNKSTTDFIDITTGETVSVKKATFSSFSGFIANPAGNKFIIFCSGNTQSAIMYDTQNDKAQIVSDNNIFNSGICNYCFIDDSTFIVTTYNQDNTAVNNICKF